MNELVSIVMPSYNTGKYISESINSVLAQTYQNWELIIVDDCSSDNSNEVIKSYLKDTRIRYIRNDNNCGAAASRNKALREAKGKWIAFLDSDDLWKSEKLEKQIRFMEENKYHFSYTNYSEISSDGTPRGITVTGPRKITKTGFYNYCWPGCLTVMYDAEFVGVIQINNIKKNNDYALWLKICKKTECYLLDENLAMYRRGRAGSVSSQSIKTMIGWHYRLYREGEEQNIVLSVFHTIRNLAFGMYKKFKYVTKENVRPMKIAVLISTMNQQDYSLLKKMKIESDAIVVNQCGRNSKDEFDFKGHRIIWINSDETGLSRSRNRAIQNAAQDICILCDDDEVLRKGYEKVIIEAYSKKREADLIAFNINRIGWDEQEKLFDKIGTIPRYKTYSSVHISFKKSSVASSNITFNVDFGTGSGKYSCAEDALFCMACHKNRFKMYTYPFVLADVYCEASSWFEGYNKKYFYDTGAYLSAAYPKTKHFVKWYYPIRCRNITDLSTKEIICTINKGMRGFKNRLSFHEYCEKRITKKVLKKGL